MTDVEQTAAKIRMTQGEGLIDAVRFMPIWDRGGLHASGPRVAVSGVGLIPLCAFSGPYEDVRLQS